MAHPVESLGLEDVSVDLVQLPPSSGSSSIDATCRSKRKRDTWGSDVDGFNNRRGFNGENSCDLFLIAHWWKTNLGKVKMRSSWPVLKNKGTLERGTSKVTSSHLNCIIKSTICRLESLRRSRQVQPSCSHWIINGFFQTTAFCFNSDIGDDRESRKKRLP